MLSPASVARNAGIVAKLPRPNWAGADPPLPEVRDCRLGMRPLVMWTAEGRRLEARLGTTHPA